VAGWRVWPLVASAVYLIAVGSREKRVVTTATTGPDTGPVLAALPAAPAPFITVHPDGSRTESVVRVVHPPGHPPSGEPIVHHCAGLTWRTR
jgi:hypothetical protein